VSKQDEYLMSQLHPLLQPGEHVLHAAYMRRQPGLLMQLLLVGGLLLFLMTKAYFAVLTDRRLILIRTKMSFWSGGPKLMNLGVEQYDVRQIRKVGISGFANNRSLTFEMADGTKQTLRISPWFKQITGTKAFFEQVPDLLSSGQLAAGAGPVQAMGGGHAASAQAGYGQPSPAGMVPAAHGAGYGAPAPQAWQAPSVGFAPGARVWVLAPDGHQHPASVVQEQNGYYLCAIQGGQQHWVPAQNVTPG
jgi:hypothetical protein